MSNEIKLAYFHPTYGRYMAKNVVPGLHNLSDDDWKRLTNNPDTLCITIDEYNRVIDSFEEFIFVNERTIQWYNSNLLYVRDYPFDTSEQDIARIPPVTITPRRKGEIIS
jgi:hypothetical protein